LLLEKSMPCWWFSKYKIKIIILLD
jgi:hypothetical protein